MSASLIEIQSRLKTHFASLAAFRAGAAPVFALEHDLSADEVSAMAGALRESLGPSTSLEGAWLAWVVYAAELGYDFDGDEYWQSFEDRTPRWRAFGDRGRVRTWFHRFHTEFGGIKPSGPWAQHFNIISWPITHAILPRDLQYQFARHLHYARRHLARAWSADVNELGRLIRREAVHSSSRFRQFVQQEALVGRLVLAILGAEEAEGDRILRDETLRRIIRDLEKTRQAKEWLEDARSTVVRFKGTTRLPTVGAAGGLPSVRQPLSRQPNLRPTLLLARTGVNRWEVRVEVPSLAELLNQSDDLRSFLSRTRSRVTGGQANFVPSSWLLGGNRTRKLYQWPGPIAAIVQFEQPNPSLEAILAEEACLSKGEVWACRVQQDGTASEVQGRQVRPDQTYILLSAGDLCQLGSSMLTRCDLECDGVSAFQLKVPASVSTVQESLITQLGLQLCRTVRVWPAGLAARGWDGEGSGEWLTTENPTFGIVHDHALEAYAVSVNGGPETVVSAGQPGQAVFITLSELEAGTHILRVRALSIPRQGQAATGQRQAEGMVLMTVREPSAWVPGTTAHGGLVVNVEPSSPNLDDFASGRLHLQIFGPDERQVDVALRTIVPPSDGWIGRQRVALPKMISDWSALISAADDDLSVASRAELVILGEELGEFRLPLEREAAPLRWACKRGSSTSLRMIDESGDDKPPRVTLRTFAKPVQPTVLDPDTCRQGFVVDPPGGLFLVESDGGEDAIIVSVQPSGHHLGLEAMKVQPNLVGDGGEVPGSSQLLDLIGLWGRARAVGWLASMRKTAVLQALEAQFYAQLCGHRWVIAEALYLENKDLHALGENIGHTYDAKSFSAVLRKGQLAGTTGQQRAAWFGDIAARYKICGDPFLSSLALRLATDPRSARIEKADGFDGEVAKLASYGMLSRGARLAALLPDSGAWRW
jgi:hypothetical protein